MFSYIFSSGPLKGSLLGGCQVGAPMFKDFSDDAKSKKYGSPIYFRKGVSVDNVTPEGLQKVF
jgi:hypothetical protein